MNSQHSITDTLFVFIHGAYQTPWMWCGVIDALLHEETDLEYILIPLPGLYKGHGNGNTYSLSSISKYIVSKAGDKTIVIVGHSLGAAFACQLLGFINYKNIVLYLSCMPVDIPYTLIKLRLVCEKSLRNISLISPVKYFPFFLKSKFITNYEDNGLLFFLKNKKEYANLLTDQNNKLKIHIGGGHFDLLTGGVKKQREFASYLDESGIVADFYNFGFTGHYPQQLNKVKYAKWILYGMICDD